MCEHAWNICLSREHFERNIIRLTCKLCVSSDRAPERSTPSACPVRLPPRPGSPPTWQHAHPSRSSRQGSRTRRDEALSLTFTSGGRTGAGFAHVWRQASTRAHELVRASAHCVRAVLVVRPNGPVESTVQDVFIFEHILMIRCSSAKISHTPPVTLFT